MHASEFHRSSGKSQGVTLLAMLALAGMVSGQTVSDNFDSYSNPNDDSAGGWTHYDPIATAPGNSDNATWTFPSDGSGGRAYRISASAPVLPKNPQTGEDTGPARVGAFRNVNYSDFFVASDIINFDDTLPQNAAALAARISAPGLLTTSGYLEAYGNSQDFRDQQGIFALVEFQTELNVSAPDQYTGGAALVSRLDPAGKYRIIFTGTGDNLQGALYNRTDLLEPIARNGAINGDLGSGNVGLVAVSYDGDNDKPTDYTFDNFYSSANPADAVAFPGTPRVLNLIPAPQTLFYSPPNNGTNIIFTATTLASTNQVATNTLQLFLNGVDVSSQLVFTEIATGKTNFTVRYTGNLATNTIYNGRIVVLNTTAPTRGTTNTWVFDTFRTNGTVTVEAEDYNYEGGIYQDNPPVSGYDVNGSIVNGGGFGYFDLVGSPDIDYHDSATSLNALERNQYRTFDYVGTAQGVRVGDTPRPKHIAAGVPDYGLWRMQAGEWVNYTRTFPSANYNVYLRTSSQARQDVRFDQITDASISNQVKSLVGDFLVPNTGSSTRFRYVPLSDAAGNPVVLNLSGVKSFRLTPLGGFDSERQHGGDDNGSLQPTYFLFVPTTTGPSQQPWLASASPSSGATDVALQPTVQLVVLNRTTHINTASVVLRFDGAIVAGSVSGTTTEGTGATVTYTPPGFLQPNTTHTISLSFADDAGSPNVQSNFWNFTTAKAPVIPASFALAASPSTNISVQINKAPNDSDGDSFPNSTYRAERQLANQLIDPATGQPYSNEAANSGAFGFYVETNAINYEQAEVSSGLFAGDTTFPGIGSSSVGYNAGDPNYIAMAATIKLSLSPGLYRMGVSSDDGFKITVGTNATATDLLLGRFEGGRGHVETPVDFVVAASGVYNFRLVYEEGTGGASVEWYWINGGVRTLIAPAQASSVELYSAATLNGSYGIESGAVINTGTKTVTVVKSTSTRFYKLRAPTALTITNITSSGGNIVLKYQ